MRSSTVIFDRISAVLGQPVVLGQLADVVKRDHDRTRRLVPEAVATLLSGLIDRVDESPVLPAGAAVLAEVAIVAAPISLNSPHSDRLPDGAEPHGQRVLSCLLGSSRQERVAAMSASAGVAPDVVEQLLGRIAPVVAAAVVEVREDLELTEADLVQQLRAERAALIDLGLVAQSAESPPEAEKVGTDTRNVAKVRILVPYTPPPDPRLRDLITFVSRPWLWWSVAVVASMVLVAVLVAPS